MLALRCRIGRNHAHRRACAVCEVRQGRRRGARAHVQAHGVPASCTRTVAVHRGPCAVPLSRPQGGARGVHSAAGDRTDRTGRHRVGDTAWNLFATNRGLVRGQRCVGTGIGHRDSGSPGVGRGTEPAGRGVDAPQYHADLTHIPRYHRELPLGDRRCHLPDHARASRRYGRRRGEQPAVRAAVAGAAAAGSA